MTHVKNVVSERRSL